MVPPVALSRYPFPSPPLSFTPKPTTHVPSVLQSWLLGGPPTCFTQLLGEDTDEDYEEEEKEEDEEEEEEEESDPRDQRAHAPGASRTKCDSVAVHPQSLPPGRSKPGSPRARLRAPRSVADTAVQDNDVQQPGEEEEEDEEEEAGFAPQLRTRDGGGHGGFSRFTGVYWNKHKDKWQAKCKEKHLGHHTTEVAAARARSKYLKDGSVPTRPVGSSQFKGVNWVKSHNIWKARCNGTNLGYHATEEDAARAYSKYLKDGIDIVTHRDASTSKFTGVCWVKKDNRWRAKCKGKALGNHTTEEAAAHVYNVEAERVGRPLNVIPPARVAGDGAGTGAGAGAGADAGGGATSKRAAPKSKAAPAPSKKTKRAAPKPPATVASN